MKTLTERRARSLLRELEQRESDLRRIVAEERERLDKEGYAELGEHSGDVADQAFARICVGHENRMLEHHLSEMRALAGARERLANGTFGVCIDCGEDIDQRRLKVAFSAVRCSMCQERYERQRALRH